MAAFLTVLDVSTAANVLFAALMFDHCFLKLYKTRSPFSKTVDIYWETYRHSLLHQIMASFDQVLAYFT